jgi:hypothetical protein
MDLKRGGYTYGPPPQNTTSGVTTSGMGSASTP